MLDVGEALAVQPQVDVALQRRQEGDLGSGGRRRAGEASDSQVRNQ